MTVQEQFTTTREVTTESVTEKINTARNELNSLKQNVSESAKIEEQKAQELKEELEMIQEDLCTLGTKGVSMHEAYFSLYNDYKKIVENPDEGLSKLTYTTSGDVEEYSTQDNQSEEETPATEEETPATEEETPATEEETPATGEDAPATEEDAPATGEETPSEEEPIEDNTNNDNGVPAEISDDDNTNWFKKQWDKLKSKEEWKDHTLKNIARALGGVGVLGGIVWLGKKIFSRPDWESRIPGYESMSRREKRKARRKWRRENR